MYAYLECDINDLQWETHIARITVKANRTLGFLRQTSGPPSPTQRTGIFQLNMIQAGVRFINLGSLLAKESDIWRQRNDKQQLSSARITYHSTVKLTSMLEVLGWDS